MIVRMYQVKRAPKSTFVPIRTLQYHVQVWGEPAPNKTPLVMVHGWMDVAASYQFVVDALAADHYVIAPDWRGFGQTQAQSFGRDGLVVQVHRALGVHHQGDRLGGRTGLAALRLGQVQADGAGHQGGCEDEDHQQDQHHVHHGRDVDLAHGRIGFGGRQATEGHGSVLRIGQQAAHIVGKAFEFGFDQCDPAPQQVVAQHGWNRYGQTQCRHD